jgi:DNA-binding NarL/FixJ family response regulator
MLNKHTGAKMRITFTEGYYNIKGQPTNVAGYSFDLVEDYKVSKSGEGYVTVEGGSVTPAGGVAFPDRKIRIRCNQGNYAVEGTVQAARVPEGVSMLTALKAKSAKGVEVTDFTQVKVPDSAVAHKTDEEIIEKTRARFQVLTDMTKAVKAGDVRAMIVTGPPGVGKSFGVEEVLAKDDLFNTLGERKPKYEIVKGAMSAIGLYAKLYEFSAEKNIIVFDDCDSVLLDDLSLNILKAALDSSKKRTISWNTDSRVLRSEGIPDRFEFKAGAIFITNIKFENVRSKKLQDHLAALESRCHYIDLQMDTDREKVLRIKQIVADGMLDEYELSDEAKIDVVDFVADNRAKLRELSLRTVLKVAQLRKAFADNWQAMAEVTVMKRA